MSISSLETTNVVDDWLDSEITQSPDCEVIAILRAATTSQKLEEHTALTYLRKLCEEPTPKDDVVR